MADDFDPDEYFRLTGQAPPLGLRASNNLFNIKYFRGAERDQTRWPGLVGPSTARDQGDPQMLFSDLPSSGVAGANLLQRKYASGMTTPRQLIAGQQGWTPGYTAAAQNVANLAGVGIDEDARLNTPEGLRRFLPALAQQEHGPTAARLMPANLWDQIVSRMNFGGGPPAPLGVPRMSLGGAPPAADIPYGGVTAPGTTEAPPDTAAPGTTAATTTGGMAPPTMMPRPYAGLARQWFGDKVGDVVDAWAQSKPLLEGLGRLGGGAAGAGGLGESPHEQMLKWLALQQQNRHNLVEEELGRGRLSVS